MHKGDCANALQTVGDRLQKQVTVKVYIDVNTRELRATQHRPPWKHAAALVGTCLSGCAVSTSVTTINLFLSEDLQNVTFEHGRRQWSGSRTAPPGGGGSAE